VIKMKASPERHGDNIFCIAPLQARSLCAMGFLSGRFPWWEWFCSFVDLFRRRNQRWDKGRNPSSAYGVDDLT
jgi:hypothetical protein